MNLQGRNLQQGLTGSDVVDLQTTLAQLSYSVPEAEKQAGSFGAGTLAAVKQFQADQNLPPTGVVDAVTESAINAIIMGNTYLVTGTVSSPVSAGVAGLALQLVDKNVGGDVVLGKGQTGARGAYSISAVISPFGLRERNKTQPDLQVQVSNGQATIASSQVVYNAPLRVTLNISLPSSAARLGSEYEALTASVSSIYKGRLAVLHENTERQDITFLANKSGWDARAVALAALSDQFSQITVPAPAPPAAAATTSLTSAAAATSAPVSTASGPVLSAAGSPPANVTPGPVAPQPGSSNPGGPTTTPATAGLRPEFYYALFRAGLPADANSLFRAPWKNVQAVWQQALTQGVIPQSLAAEIPNAIQTYQALAASNLLQATPVVGISNLGAMLTVSKLNVSQQATFSRLYASFGDDPPTFWKNVSSSLGESVAKQLQVDGQIFYLSLNNAPLVGALYNKEGQAGPLASTLDLVTRGYYDATKWEPLIGQSVPKEIPGQSAANYAEFLAAQVRLSYPTAVAADQVKRGIFPISDKPATATAVSTFLTTHQAAFAIGAEPVEAYLARTNVTGVQPEVVRHVKRLQRVYQLSTNDQNMAVLLRHNVDSAYAITRYDAAGFQRAFADKLGGADNAAATYARARHVYSSVMNLAVGYLAARQAPGLGGTTTILNGFPAAAANQTYPVVAYPTLESLFGSLDYCSCGDCRSILSPAAYLVDLLHYIDQPSPSPGYQNPQAVLLQRRPDLQYLPLSCENTNTAMPYIDIVNETLEYYVANHLSIANFQGYSTDDTVTSAELLANPQFANDAAYATLQGAFFPPPLPFSRPLAQLRQLFQNMGVALPDVMYALDVSKSTAIQETGTAYSEGDVLIEQLGISRDEYRVFTDGTLKLQALYGYAGSDAAVMAILQAITLQDYSRRTGVSYDDIVSILQTQFINPNAVLIERLGRLGVPFSTLQTLPSNPSTAAAFIAGLPAGLDARAYGGATPTDYNAVVKWVVSPTNFARIMSIITLSNPTNSADTCSGEAFQFRYANGKPLTATDFVKLIRFIRLWQKLGLTIEQTDDILAALYPAADLPSGSNDATNLPLLDAGFQVALLRIGVLYQMMERLSLTANQALGQLLACWAPIGTVGDHALYQQMFGGPTLQLEDPGAPITTVGGAPSAGDQLVTTIDSVAIPQTVNPGDTPATIAANIAARINATTTPDPVTMLPLNQRIAASSQSAVVTIRAGFALTCSPAGVLTAKTVTPLAQSVTFTGAVTAGGVLTVVVNTVPIPYTMQSGDTPSSIAVNLANAINNCSSPDPYSSLPLNSLLIASASGAAVRINSVNSGAPFSLACSLIPGSSASYAVGTQVPAHQTATVGGTVANGDVLTTNINRLNIPFTVAGQTTAAAVAAAIVTNLNGTTAADPGSGRPLNSVLHATSSGGVVTIAANDPAIAVAVTCSATGAMTYTQAGPFATTQTANVTGAFAAGAVLYTTINGITVPYAVAVGDTPATIATHIANAINTNSSVDPLTNTPLNLLVSAGASGGVVSITASGTTGGFTLTAGASAGTYTAGVQPPPFADNGYGDFLADPTQTVFGHEPAVRAAFNLTGAEFTLIANALQFTASTPLTLTNISSIFRIGWLAHTLEMSVTEFLLLRQATGIDPFQPLDPNAAPPFDPPALNFIRLVQTLSNAGLRPVQALYLLWNIDITGKSTPPLNAVTGLAFALRAAFSAVAAQFTIQTDPDGSIAQGLMALVYGATATNFFFGLLNNTLVTSMAYPNSRYPNPQPAPLQPVLDASGGRLSYDDLRKRLNFTGVLDAATQSAIAAAITADQNVPALAQALADLAVANQQLVGPFFAIYPELRPLYTAYEVSNAPATQKRSKLLANFLPTLIQKRNQEQALATVTAAAGTDPSFANALLNDATVLHAAADLTAPIVNDLTALDTNGLAAQIFLSNSPAGPPDIVLDADPVAYAPAAIGAQETATVSGKLTAGDVLKTAINGVSVSYTVKAADRTEGAVASGIAAAINATGTTDSFSGLPLKDVVQASAAGGTVTVQAANPGSGVSVGCSVTPLAAAPTYTAGPQVAASQTATVAGTITPGDVLITTINTIAVPYTVVAGDSSVTVLAAHLAAAVNATATADPVSGLPLNQVVTAASTAGVVTLTAALFGPDFNLACSTSGGATETYTTGPKQSASQTATLSGTLPANDAAITTINSVSVSYTMTPADTTVAILASHVAAAINATTSVDTLTGKALNALVTASSAGGVVTIATIPPGAPVTVACSITLGAFTLGGQAAILQTAIVSGGINAGDTLSTTVNGITVPYAVTGVESGIAAVAAAVAGAVNAKASLAGVVTASSLGGIVILRAAGGTGFSLTCSTSPQAAASYATGPQFPAWQATVMGGFFAGDILTAAINDATVSYTIGPSDTTPAAVAAHVAAAINASAATDPLTGLPVNGLVSASSAGGTITFRAAGPALVMSCSISAGATAHFAIDGEFPARPGGGPIAGIWSGYLTAPQDGYYNIEIDTDPGASVTLAIGGVAVTLGASSNSSVWSNESPLLLTAGQLTPIQITAKSLESALSLNWESAGLGWQPVPPVFLYSDTQMDRLQTAYVRFLKATSLATTLSLTADEIAFLGTSGRYAVNTTDSRDNLLPGTVTFTPASMANITVGSMLVIDSGDAQEVVTVTAATPTTFKAAIRQAHDGTVAPFPIVDAPNASTGAGWLNLLAVSPIAGSATAGLQPIASYTAGPQASARQTATVAGTITAGNALTTTINGVGTSYTVVGGDTAATIAGKIAAAVNGNATPDPVSGLPLNQAVSASSAGAVVTITAQIFGPNFSLTCSLSGGATETYTPGTLARASQTATIAGQVPVNEAVVTTINGISVSYTVTAADSTPAALAGHVAAAINAVTAVDPVSGLPLNAVAHASSAGAVVTITTFNPGAPLTVSCSLASFQRVVGDVLDFARMKAAISPNDEQLLGVLQNPNVLSADGATPQIVKLTGWAASSVATLLQRFFGNTQLSNLGSVANLREVFDVFGIVTTCRLSASALLAATTNAPTPATVASLQSALRALYAPSDWLNVIKPINDALRIQQRDALVAYILQQLGDQYAGSLVTQQTAADASAGSTTVTLNSAAGIVPNMSVEGADLPPNTMVASVSGSKVTLSAASPAKLPSGSTLVFAPAGANNIASPDKLYEYFLIDVETQPPVETSRIRLALSAVQLFIERVLRNLEPQVQPTDIDGSLWTWMKRYRVWQANREVFLWPENWLYPELRDDQSPIFQQMMSALLQSDITDDAAAEGYLDYLSNLELVAKLEPCGLYYVPATGDSDELSYVVGRTAGAHRKYFFRALEFGSWTPWTEIKIECEDAPVTPVVWNGRLMLFWLKIHKTGTPQPAPSTSLSNGRSSSDTVTNLSLDDIGQFGHSAAGSQTQKNENVSAVLYWSEYYNGKWQPQKSSDVNRPASLGTFNTGAFDPDRNLLAITPVDLMNNSIFGPFTFIAPVIPPESLVLSITSPVNETLGGFVLFNTHSLPVRWDDSGFFAGFVPIKTVVSPPDPGRTLQPAGSYTGGPSYASFSITYWTLEDGPDFWPANQNNAYVNTLFGLNRVPRTVDAAPSTAGWDAPFLFEDRRNVFYVRTAETNTFFFQAPGYGIIYSGLDLAGPSSYIPPLVLDSPPPLLLTTPFSVAPTGGGGPAAVAKFVAQDPQIHSAIGSGTAVVYQGTRLLPTGQVQEQSTLAQFFSSAASKAEK